MPNPVYPKAFVKWEKLNKLWNNWKYELLTTFLKFQSLIPSTDWMVACSTYSIHQTDFTSANNVKYIVPVFLHTET